MKDMTYYVDMDLSLQTNDNLDHRILVSLRSKPEGATVTLLADRLDCAPSKVASALNRLGDLGAVRQTDGVWFVDRGLA